MKAQRRMSRYVLSQSKTSEESTLSLPPPPSGRASVCGRANDGQQRKAPNESAISIPPPPSRRVSVHARATASSMTSQQERKETNETKEEEKKEERSLHDGRLVKQKPRSWFGIYEVCDHVHAAVAILKISSHSTLTFCGLKQTCVCICFFFIILSSRWQRMPVRGNSVRRFANW